MRLIRFLAIILLFVSCNKENSTDTVQNDPIIGTWTELGRGDVFDDGKDEFSEYDYFCVTLGRFAFDADGTFRIETFDGPDDGCFSTGILTGTWENNVTFYSFKIVTDTSRDPEPDQESSLKIDFPSSNEMRWISLENSNTENIDYSYEIYTRVE
ncbi:hypothetical protein [Cellulophaga sp. L1A9]|uniref:hypothetical protein n=1 Tax=Cellulophaga sp. L1A9 TaxID=2686362 RepID=UPI00131C0C51|nr:hypothetical protein [Cellulophaga sp. L1A9]